MFKKANSIGFGIIGLALLLFLGGIFFESTENLNNSTNQNNNQNNNQNDEEGFFSENYLFYLNETYLGLQRRVIDSFPNIQIGSKLEFNTIFIGNTFILQANPLTANSFSFDISFTQEEFVKKYLIYFSPNRISGKQNLKIFVDNELVYNGRGLATEIPLVVQKKPGVARSKVSIQLEKPKWYSIFNWNKFEISDLRIVEEKQDIRNNKKEFNFNIDLVDLDRVFIELVVSCEEVSSFNLPIEIKVNDFILSNQNPSCESNFNRIQAEVPTNILQEDRNTLELYSEGYYVLAYNLNKLYYNEKDVYKFTLTDFNDIVDVIMYGRFDQDVIDLRLNSRLISLDRNEIKSITQYLRSGTNEIRFLTKPIKFDEFFVEKVERIN